MRVSLIYEYAAGVTSANAAFAHRAILLRDKARRAEFEAKLLAEMEAVGGSFAFARLLWIIRTSYRLY